MAKRGRKPPLSVQAEISESERWDTARFDRFEKQPRVRSFSRKQPFVFANVAIGTAPNLALGRCDEDCSRIDRNGATTQWLAASLKARSSRTEYAWMS